LTATIFNFLTEKLLNEIKEQRWKQKKLRKAKERRREIIIFDPKYSNGSNTENVNGNIP
jgi:hypothetical protein